MSLAATWEVREGDCLELLDSLPDDHVDAVITDPPYHLTQLSRRGSPRKPGTGPFGRHTLGQRGFMGKTWDGGGVAHDPATWAKCLRVVKPGGHLLAFGGSRTFHRLGCALEDAGFELRGCICWVFASGFPKAHNVAKAIAKRENGQEAARPWEGWSTALKPAYEPIFLCRKPLAGTVAANVLQYRTGALNIDATRIAYRDGEVDFEAVQRQQADPQEKGWSGNVAAVGTEIKMFKEAGRWPADFVVSHHPGCVQVGTTTVPGRVINRWSDGAKPFGDGAGHPYESQSFPDEKVALWRCVESCPVRLLDKQGGVRRSGKMSTSHRRQASRLGHGGVYGDEDPAERAFTEDRAASSGTASRFFFTAKASRREREAGVPKPETGRTNAHPTVKPLELMRWLVRLVTPPLGLVLDPFMGSGTTGCAVVLEGHRFLGMELDPSYVELARHRIRHWRGIWYERQQGS